MVHTTELATIIIIQEKYVPIKGVSDEGGCISDTTFMKKVRDIRMVISKDPSTYYDITFDEKGQGGV